MKMQKVVIRGLAAITLTVTAATYLKEKETQEVDKYLGEYQEAYPIGIQIEVENPK